MCQTPTQIAECGPLRNPLDFLEEIIGKGKPFHRGSGFQFAMKLVRDIAKLNHLSHVHNISTCGVHVNMLRYAKRMAQHPKDTRQTSNVQRPTLSLW